MTYFEKYIHFVNKLLSTHENSHNNVEFELKLLFGPNKSIPKFLPQKQINKQEYLRVCKDIFKILTEKNGQPVEEQTINFIKNIQSELNTSTIKRLYFIKGVQQKERKTIYTKKVMNKPIYIENKIINLKLSTSLETPIDPNTEVEFDIIRFKRRYIFAHIIPDFEVHFTFVKMLESKELSIMKKYRSTLFDDVNDCSEASSLWTWVDSIEIEIEYIGKTQIKPNIFITILNLINDFNSTPILGGIQNLQSLLVDLSKTLGKKYLPDMTLNKLLPKVIEVNKKQYFEEVLANINSFYITDKADGVRVLLTISDNICYIQDTINIVTSLENAIPMCMLECEKIEDKYYIFDIIMHKNKSVINLAFSERLDLMNEYNEYNKYNIYVKKFYKLDAQYDQTISNLWTNISDKPYDVDGIIFTSGCHTYNDTKYYKWKPIDRMSIDFLAKKCPPELLGIYPYINKPEHTLFILFSGIKYGDSKKMGLEKISYYGKLFPIQYKNYFPIQFSPSDEPYAYLYWHSKNNTEDISNKIIEMTYDITNKKWVMLRLRPDKKADLQNKNYFGNNYRVAELIWRNFSNPLTIHDLCKTRQDFSKEFYFLKRTTNIHNDIRGFNNFVKYEILSRFDSNITNKDTIIDLASGHGQDLFKYLKLKMGALLFIDVNENNLCEIINRKYKYVHDNKYQNEVRLYIKKIDLNSGWKNNIKELKHTGFPIVKKYTPLVVCNFAIHYFCQNTRKLTNFIKFVNELVSSGGRFIFTCLDGKLVFDLLKKNNGQWGDGTKYLISRDFPDEKFTGINQKINILLPFSNGLYSEYLVDLDSINNIFTRHKFKLETYSGFDIYLKKYGYNFKDMDIEYIKLLSFNIYYK